MNVTYRGFRNLLLCFMIIFPMYSSVINQAVHANSHPFDSGNGTAVDPYIITTAEQLNEIRNHIQNSVTYQYNHFRLGANIDLDVAPYNTGAGWEPLPRLYGSFNGAGYTISNLMINRPETLDVGLFAEMFFNTEIKNLHLENVSIIGGVRVGSIVGMSWKGEITDVTVSGDISGNGNVGGIVGWNAGGIIEDVLFIGSAVGRNVNQSAHTGSIVGSNGNYDGSTGTVKNAYGFGTVTAQIWFGGISGYNEGRLEHVYSMHVGLLITPNPLSLEYGRITGGSADEAQYINTYAFPGMTTHNGSFFNDDNTRNGVSISEEDLSVIKGNVNQLLPEGDIKNRISRLFDAMETWYDLPIYFTEGDIPSRVTQNITLNNTGVNNIPITWISSDPSSINNTGVVNRPTYNNNIDVNLTATIGQDSDIYRNSYFVTLLKADPRPISASTNSVGDRIDILFEQNINVVDISKLSLTINGDTYTNFTHSYSGSTLIINLTNGVSPDQDISVTMEKGTVKDNNDSENVFVTLDVTNNLVANYEVSNFTIELSDSTQGVENVDYTFTFQTSPFGAMLDPNGFVEITFPNNMTIPNTIEKEKVTFEIYGQFYPLLVDPIIDSANNKVRLPIPTSIGGNTLVTIIFDSSVGIQNPLQGGSYTFNLSTSIDTTLVQANFFIITEIGTLLRNVSIGSVVEFGGFEWLVVTPNDESNPYAKLLLNGHIGTNKPFTMRAPYYEFDPTDDVEGNQSLAYYLNSDFYNSIEGEEKSWIVDHPWDVKDIDGDILYGQTGFVNAKVGLLTANEFEYFKESIARDLMLSTGPSYWWLLTPVASCENCDDFDVHEAYSSGELSSWNGDGTSFVRPAIYVQSNVIVTAGNGTEDSPFELALEDEVEQPPVVPNAPTINLSTTPTTPTNQPVTVIIDVFDQAGVDEIKWASGNQNAAFFSTGGKTVTNSIFMVTSNGPYTVYAKNTQGIEAVQTITISNISTETSQTIYIDGGPFLIYRDSLTGQIRLYFK